MIRRHTAWCLALAWVSMLGAVTGCNQQAKPDELAGRVQELEKRVAELEKGVQQSSPPAKDTKTATENKLVGNWLVTEADRQAKGIFTDLKLKPDGTGMAVLNLGVPERQWNNLKYDLVGKQLLLRGEHGGQTYSIETRVQSVNDTELILEYRTEFVRDGKRGDEVKQVRYTRDK